jgi:hypothetical protein
MKTRALLLVAAIAYPSAGGGLLPPTAGWVRDRAEFVRPLIGVRGNLLLGEPLVAGAVRCAFSGSLGVVKTRFELLLIGPDGAVLSRSPAPEGDVLVAFGPEETQAAVYFREARELWLRRGGAWERIEFGADAAGGEIAAVGTVHAAGISLVIRRDDCYFQRRVSFDHWAVEGEIALPGIGEPMILAPEGDILHADGLDGVLRTANGVEERFAIGFPAARIEMAGGGWFAVEGTGGERAVVRLGGSVPEVFGVPEAAR